MNEREKKLVYWKWWESTLKRILKRKMSWKIYRRRRADLLHARRVIKALKAGIVVCVLLLALSGCCTLKGIAQDIEWTAGQVAENVQTEKE